MGPLSSCLFSEIGGLGDSFNGSHPEKATPTKIKPRVRTNFIRDLQLREHSTAAAMKESVPAAELDNLDDG